MKKFTKIALIVASFVLVAALSVGGTLAWLTATTKEVTNTFVKGEITIKLDEAEVYVNGESEKDALLGQKKDPEKRVNSNVYQAIPGNTYFKDPTVTVVAKSEKCWLFVEFIENDSDDYYNYTSTLTAKNGWTQGDGTDIPNNVWYREVDESETNQSWVLLENLGTAEKPYHLAVKEKEVTADTMAEAVKQSLEWNAYAVQYANLTAANAWKEVAPATTT